MLALVAAGAIVWLLARQESQFSIVGMDGPASSALGSLLPAVSAGLTIAMSLVIVDVVGGPVVAVLAAICVLLLPDFLPLHRSSLIGPPLLATTIGMLAVMLAAPRFSLAYGAVAAVGVVWVSPQAIGLVPAAVAWALLQPNGQRGRVPRAALSLLPLGIAVLLTALVGSAWPAPVHLGWRELNDTFLLPFEMAVKGANAGSVMPAYHDIDNESVHASRHPGGGSGKTSAAPSSIARRLARNRHPGTPYVLSCASPTTTSSQPSIDDHANAGGGPATKEAVASDVGSTISTGPSPTAARARALGLAIGVVRAKRVTSIQW